jgi:hypothetical protein
MTTVPVSLDLESTTLDRLAARERETGESQSELAQRYIEEGLRMERHPGIVFVDGPVGRRPALRGGPDIWEVAPELQGVKSDDTAEIEAVAAWMALPVSAVRAALGYYIEFRDEIDAWVDRNARLAEQHRAAWRAERGLPPD